VVLHLAGADPADLADLLPAGLFPVDLLPADLPEERARSVEIPVQPIARQRSVPAPRREHPPVPRLPQADRCVTLALALVVALVLALVAVLTAAVAGLPFSLRS